MNVFNRIIFVCSGNTCRSPMAAIIMANELGNQNIEVESRGMVVLFPEPYNPKAVAVASMHGLILPNNGAIQITNNDFDNKTLVLVMDRDMKKKLYSQYCNAINVYTIGEFVGEAETVICDPYGKGMEEYNRCFDQLQILLKQAAANIRKTFI